MPVLFLQGFWMLRGQLEIDGDVLFPVREPLTQMFCNIVADSYKVVNDLLAPGCPVQKDGEITVEHRENPGFQPQISFG